MRQALVTCFATPLLFGLALSSCFPMPALLFCLRSPILLSFCLFIIILSFSPMPVLLSLLMSALSSSPIATSLYLSIFALSFCSVLGPVPTCFIFSALKTLKQTLSDESLGHYSTSPALQNLFFCF